MPQFFGYSPRGFDMAILTSLGCIGDMTVPLLVAFLIDVNPIYFFIVILATFVLLLVDFLIMIWIGNTKVRPFFRIKPLA